MRNEDEQAFYEMKRAIKDLTKRVEELELARDQNLMKDQMARDAKHVRK